MSEKEKPQVIIIGAGATGKTIIMEALKKDAEDKGKKVVVFKRSEERKDLSTLLINSPFIEDELPLFKMASIVKLGILSPIKKRKKHKNKKRK